MKLILKKIKNKISSSKMEQHKYYNRRKGLRKWLLALIFILLFGTTISLISQHIQNKKSLLSDDAKTSSIGKIIL